MKHIVTFSMLLTACSQQSPGDQVTANAPAAKTPVAKPPQPPFAEVDNAHPSAPEPAPIPARFRGLWANTPNACKDLAHYSRLVISGRTLRYADFVLLGDTFAFPAADQFAVEGKIEGKDEAGAAHFSINQHGDLLRDEAGGGTIRVRCP